MAEPHIVGVAGDSGVGKTTISKLIRLYYGDENSVIISTDDLHKWERSNEIWKTTTHLNKVSNNLELGDIHLKELREGKSVYRSKYDHKTGYFKPPQKIHPKKNIIVEGLHAFYTEYSKQNIDLKIFIDTEKTLRKHWKILRDTEERGHSYNEVLESIKRRETDTNDITEKQITCSDVVIKLRSRNKIENVGSRNEKIDLSVTIENKSKKSVELFAFIKDFMNGLHSFFSVSETIGNNIELVQGKGGNISIKTGDYVIIKPSGFRIKDLKNLNKISVIGLDDFELKDLLVTGNLLKPSLEFKFHTLFDKYVLHTHPVYLVLLLSLVNSELILKDIYKNFDYDYIGYTEPGEKLYEKINNTKNIRNIVFLERHGLIVSSDSGKEAVNITLEINGLAEKHLRKMHKNNFRSFGDFIKSDEGVWEKLALFTFPDSAVFLQGEKVGASCRETYLAQKYIIKYGSKIGELNALNEKEIRSLNSMESEKYRREGVS